MKSSRYLVEKSWVRPMENEVVTARKLQIQPRTCHLGEFEVPRVTRGLLEVACLSPREWGADDGMEILGN